MRDHIVIVTIELNEVSPNVWRYKVEVWKQSETHIMVNIPSCYLASNDEAIARRWADEFVIRYNALLIDTC